MNVPVSLGKQDQDYYPSSPASTQWFSFSEVMENLWRIARRQFLIFLFVLPLSLILGLAYLITTPAKYTSHAMLLMDSSKVRILQQQSQSPLGDVPIDTAQVETQVEILKSENIGLSVLKENKLINDPELSASGRGVFSRLFNWRSWSEPSQDKLTRDALATFLARRTISRVGRTYVLDIGYTSLDPNKAALVANAIADAYIVDQLDAKYQATRRASGWLQDRIRELRAQVSAADRAVLDYKESNNIVDVGAGGATTGARLLGEQQLGELNSQLGTARAATAEAKARLERIQEMMRQEVPDAAVADSLRNEVITKLRSQYLDMANREAVWASRYGRDHLAAVNLRTQMHEIKRSIADELRRIGESYMSDYKIAKSREETVEKDLARLVADTQSTNRDRLGLRDLESTAQVYHNIYDNFLQRYMEALQQQSFPITEARVISAAAPPTHKSSPVPAMVMSVAGTIGLLLSFAVAALREATDKVFRTARQVENTLDLNCLAVLPLLVEVETIKSFEARQGHLMREGSDLNQREALIERRSIRHVVDDPLSPFAEALRSIKVAVDISSRIKATKVIGITSTLPKEGKSTVSSNFAQLIAHAGKSVVLVDGDLRNPTLTRLLSPEAVAGVLQVLDGSVSIEGAMHRDEQTGLSFLPAVINSRIAHTNEVLSSAAFGKLIEKLRGMYEYVVVDFPPLAPVVDVRAACEIVDYFLFVVEWGQTRTNLVQHQLQSAPQIKEKTLGVVLNKAKTELLSRYESYYERNYYGAGYGGSSMSNANGKK
ncbi:polysaccharide biosynthesis tyrosine autokinase [Bradyrhizobium diazoefficiens]|nr:polysaccharide biosynthesis tyrosine autokinase [Bradyrhizobium diazoefficiens]MBR0703714.1 polysaccharide biosynthesis tyrosine autokinase [Bradyrhizobium diazoefficiens]MBR0772470.1 polysaccharide biosynthesis tyrosine autokinase [Bradyrhizobium diazoefficiens]